MMPGTNSFRYIAFDVETTGFSPQRGERIIEVGAVAVAGDDIVDEFSSLIDPCIRITKGAYRVHGISNDLLCGMPKSENVLPVFHRFVDNSELIAHNASFDIAFLRYEFSRLGLPFSNRYHCTLALSRKRLPTLRDHKLETVYRHLFGAPPNGERMHRALNDARMAARVWLELMKSNI